jgi:hypothetical protein
MAEPANAYVPVMVLSEDDADLQSLVSKLKTIGMRVEKTLEVTGVILGTLQEDQIASAEAVKGVAAVEKQGRVAIR